MSLRNGNWRCIGLMSGTSCDGLDIAQVLFKRRESEWSFEIEKVRFFPYTEDFAQCLLNAIHLDKNQLASLDLALGEFFLSSMKSFLNNSTKAIDLISSHGHTVFHRPDEGYTLQIGSVQALFREFNIQCVYDFRSQDVELGGQGAPLVPIGDRDLFHQYDACVNLGGFANASYNKDGKRLAFDICPLNLILNHFSRRLGLSYDKGGLLASDGILQEQILNKLNALPYYSKVGPKSLGREDIDEIIALFGQSNEKDCLRTAIEHMAIQIANVLNEANCQSVLFTGGGALNTFLMERIDFHLFGKRVKCSTDLIQYKESVIFAYLGLLRTLGEDNCLSSVTGSKHDHCSGKIIR